MIINTRSIEVESSHFVCNTMLSVDITVCLIPSEVCEKYISKYSNDVNTVFDDCNVSIPNQMAFSVIGKILNLYYSWVHNGNCSQVKKTRI